MTPRSDSDDPMGQDKDPKPHGDLSGGQPGDAAGSVPGGGPTTGGEGDSPSTGGEAESSTTGVGGEASWKKPAAIGCGIVLLFVTGFAGYVGYQINEFGKAKGKFAHSARMSAEETLAEEQAAYVSRMLGACPWAPVASPDKASNEGMAVHQPTGPLVAWDDVPADELAARSMRAALVMDDVIAGPGTSSDPRDRKKIPGTMAALVGEEATIAANNVSVAAEKCVCANHITTPPTAPIGTDFADMPQWWKDIDLSVGPDVMKLLFHGSYGLGARQDFLGNAQYRLEAIDAQLADLGFQPSEQDSGRTRRILMGEEPWHSDRLPYLSLVWEANWRADLGTRPAEVAAVVEHNQPASVRLNVSDYGMALIVSSGCVPATEPSRSDAHTRDIESRRALGLPIAE